MESLVDEVEAESQSCFGAGAEAAGAEFGGVLIDVRDIHAEVVSDDVGTDPARPLA
jgi:hypothetical protein